MKRGRFTETQIVSSLKDADAGGKVKDICRQHGISDATYYNWKSKYGGMTRTLHISRRPEVLSRASGADYHRFRPTTLAFKQRVAGWHADTSRNYPGRIFLQCVNPLYECIAEYWYGSYYPIYSFLDIAYPD